MKLEGVHKGKFKSSKDKAVACSCSGRAHAGLYVSGQRRGLETLVVSTSRKFGSAQNVLRDKYVES